MEVRFLQLGAGLLLLLAAQPAPTTALPSPQCQKKCGNVEIQYPFGIGLECSLAPYFNVSCRVQEDGISKPFISDDLELLDTSLTRSTIRVLNNIATYCYNASGLLEANFWGFDASPTPYRFSDILNKFIVIGCNTIGFISDSDDSKDRSYLSGCISTCSKVSDLTNGSCSGVGCCQTTIPRGMSTYRVNFQIGANTSRTWRCNYAVLMEAAAFNFSTTYINTFNETNAGGQVPMVLDWAIRNESSCEVARRNKTGTYACLSSNSECADSSNGPGYVCSCSKGYAGNPYLPGGCQGTDLTLFSSHTVYAYMHSICFRLSSNGLNCVFTELSSSHLTADYDECKDSSSCPSGGICRNTEGGYQCSCRAGRKFSDKNKTCDPDTGLIIGNTIR
jgi:hypothetical protein